MVTHVRSRAVLSLVMLLLLICSVSAFAAENRHETVGHMTANSAGVSWQVGADNDSVALTISGLTSLDSLQVNLDMNGPTSPVPNPATLEPPTSCVAGDAVSPPG